MVLIGIRERDSYYPKKKKKKKASTFIRLVKNPRTDITISIPMNKRDMYCINIKNKLSDKK